VRVSTKPLLKPENRGDDEEAGKFMKRCCKELTAQTDASASGVCEIKMVTLERKGSVLDAGKVRRT